MNNFFYYVAIISIIEAIRSSFAANKEIDNYKAGISIPNKNLSSEELDDLKSTLVNSLKGKIVQAILGALMIVWAIIGILYTPEWKLFLSGICITVISAAIVGHNKKFRKTIIIVISNILSIIINLLILYLHFS